MFVWVPSLIFLTLLNKKGNSISLGPEKTSQYLIFINNIVLTLEPFLKDTESHVVYHNVEILINFELKGEFFLKYV